MRKLWIILFLLPFLTSGQTTIDSYVEANADGYAQLYAGFYEGYAQSFTASARYKVTSCKFYGYKEGTPPGNVYARLYRHTGTYGTSSLPDGSYIAISDAVLATSLSTSAALITFTFSGANQVPIESGYYCIAIIYEAGDASNYIRAGRDGSSPTHSGNRMMSTDADSWSAVATHDMVFYIYGTALWGDKVSGVGRINKVSATSIISITKINTVP